MRVIFFGTPELAVPTLASVAEKHDVAAVVCQPDRPQGRSSKLIPPPTKMWARDHTIEVVQPVALNTGQFEAWLRRQAPEVCVLVAYGRILKQPILDVPKHGFLNMHPSLLPKYRGPSPIQTAILNGESTTGITIMRLDAGMDTGDMLLQETAEILPDDTTATLSDRLAEHGARMMVSALDLVASGQAVFARQDHSIATLTSIYEKKDGQIRWAAPAREIHNLVRAAIPWPVAHCLYSGEVCRIHKTDVVAESADSPPGTVTRVERDRLVLATGEGQLAISTIQMPGKKSMPVADFLRGHSVPVGAHFEDI